MAHKKKILVVDDDRKHREMLATLLSQWGHETILASDGGQAVSICAGQAGDKRPDLALMDVRMPGMNGIDALREIRKISPELPVIIMTAYSEIPDAVEAIRMGAYDYLTKPLDFGSLQKNIANALVQKEVKDNGTANAERAGTGRIIGKSRPMQELYGFIDKIAPTEATVLINGESGTGKELAARAVHEASGHAKGPFVAVNCGALTESLLASELFGHEKGAFTGADKKHMGLFLEAGDGSIFLDEIGEMSLSMQVKLLRVLQEKEVLSVGGKKAQPIKCRILAATNRDLAEDVRNGLFRQDLYYRLNVVTINMPPLRDRKDDIPSLATGFAEKFAAMNSRKFSGITSAAMNRLMEYDWPGNVRELENIMERAIILMPDELVDVDGLPERMNPAPYASGQSFIQDAVVDVEGSDEISGSLPTLEEVERRVILKTLERTGNNKTEAARVLGITRKTLHAKLNRYREGDSGESE